MRRTSERCSDGEVDLRQLIYTAAGQIPEGRVATYGDVALALGDIKAARAVGMILAGETPPDVPKHRVVYNDGHIGWYEGAGRGQELKVRLLTEEGLMIENGRVADMDDVRFRDFALAPVLKDLAAHQERLRSRLVCEDDFGDLRLVAGLDVSYSDDHAFGAIVTYDIETGERLSQRTVETEVCFPYVPGYLAFREVPVIRPLVTQHRDIIYLVDGHGVLHPRGFGIASMLGVELDAPTIGAAKNLLVGSVEDGSSARRHRVVLDGRTQGCRIGGPGRSATFVSVGHRISLHTATEVCDRLMRTSVPEPLLVAHRLANAMRLEYEKERQSK